MYLEKVKKFSTILKQEKDAGLVIGHHGKVLNSLQTLAQIQLHQVAQKQNFLQK